MATLMDIVKKGSTNRSVTLRIIDSSDGTPETGVVFNTSGIDLWYRRESAAVVPATEADLATPALTDAHLDWGFLHISHGEYRFDLPDAAFATGAQHVDIGGTVTGMIVIGGRVRLVDYDPEDGTRLGLTAMPNAAADAAGGLAISDAGGLDLDARLDAAVSSRLAPTVASRTLDVTSGGEAGIDLDNTSGTLAAAQIASGAITAAKFAAGAIDAAAIASDAITAVKIAADAITAAKIASDAIGAAELATDAVNEIRDAILSDSTAFKGADIAAILVDTATTLNAKINDLQTMVQSLANR